MGMDEALLASLRDPVLRVYRWSGVWASFGVSQSLSMVANSRPGVALVRRWTGGGIVDHADDWTFSLVVPRGTALGALRPMDSYRAVHRAVVNVIGDSSLSRQDGDVRAAACFSGAPVRHDVVGPDGRKLCGGAQRRTRTGFLHQGSVVRSVIPPEMGSQLAWALAEEVIAWCPDAGCLAAAAGLACDKYAAEAWTGRVR